MAEDFPDADLDGQDLAEVFDETHLDEDAAEVSTFEDLPDVYDATAALGDGRDLAAMDGAELEPEALDDEDLEEDEDLDDSIHNDLEDDPEDDDIDDEDEDAEDAVDQLEPDEVDVETVADVDQVTRPGGEDVQAMGHKKGEKPRPKTKAASAHQEDLLDEGIEETFPASDPVSVKRIT